MKFIYNEKGSVSLVVVAILLFMTTVGFVVLIMTSTDLKTAFDVSWKSKSDALVEFAVEEYRDRVNEVLIQEDSYYVEDTDLSLLNTDPFYLVEGGDKEADIEFFEVEFSQNSFETNYEYLNSLTNTEDKDGGVFYKDTPIGGTFEARNYGDIVGSGSGIISTVSIYNEAYNANEFFISKTVFSNSTGLMQDIRLFSHFPSIETGTDEALLVSTKTELEAAMGGTYNLDQVTLNDDVIISATWDETYNSPKIVMSISVSLENRIHLFTLTPLIDNEFQYFDTMLIPEKVLQSEVKAVFDKNLGTVVTTLNLLTERTKTEHILTTYPIHLPLDTSVDTSKKVELIIPDVSRTISTSMFWNDALKATQLYVFSSEDVKTVDGPEFSSKISVYKLNVGIDSDFDKTDEIDLSTFASLQVHTLGSEVFWSDALNDGFVHLLFSSPNETDLEGNYKLFHLETSVFDFNATEITEIDTASNNITNIGKISVTGSAKEELGELMVFLEKSFVRIEKVVLEKTTPYNIIISSYEDNSSGRIGARTKIILEPEVEVITIMDSNIRYVKSFKIKELIVE